MKTHVHSLFAWLAALSATLATAPGVRADWFYDFQAPLPASFVMGAAPRSETFGSDVGGGVLRLFDTQPPAQGGAAVVFGVDPEPFTNVRVTGTLNPTGMTDNILNLSRGDTAGHAYSAGIDFSTGVLNVAKINGPVAPVELVQSSDAGQGSQPPLTNLATGYFLEVDFVGNHVTARVFDAEGGTQLLVVNYTDTGVGGPAYTSGFAGMSAVSTSGPVDGTFGPVGARAIPAWFYDFQTPPPASFLTGSEPFDPASPTFSSSVDGGVLRLFDTEAAADGGATVGFAFETSQVFADVRVTGTLNPTGTTDNILNLTVRGDPQGNVYAAGVDFRAGTLNVAKLVGGGAPVELVFSTDASQGSQPPLSDLVRSYFLQVDAAGNNLTARVFDVEGGTQLLVVHYTDTGVGGPPHESGMAGVSAVSTGGRVDGTFGTVAAGPIP